MMEPTPIQPFTTALTLNTFIDFAFSSRSSEVKPPLMNIATVSNLSQVLNDVTFRLCHVLCKRTLIAATAEITLSLHFFLLWIVRNCAGTYGANQRMKYSNKLIEAELPLDRYVTCFQNKEEFKKLLY